LHAPKAEGLKGRGGVLRRPSLVEQEEEGGTASGHRGQTRSGGTGHQTHPSTESGEGRALRHRRSFEIVAKLAEPCGLAVETALLELSEEFFDPRGGGWN
jgi:hypothetical protein